MAIYSVEEIRDLDTKITKFVALTDDTTSVELLTQAQQVIAQLLRDRHAMSEHAQRRDQMLRQIQVDVQHHVALIDSYQRENEQAKRITTSGSER
jgi:hypothetical protein